MFEKYLTRGFIVKRPMKLESFRVVEVERIVCENWESTVSNIPRFVTKVIHEFYANLSDEMLVEGEEQFEKSFVRGYVYDFSPRVISEYLNIPIPENFNFERDYMLDDVASELLGHKTDWLRTNVLRVADLTLKYKGLNKIALSNWYPTKHVTTLSHDIATLLFDIGTNAPVHPGHIIFYRSGANISQKLPLPSLIFGLLESQKSLQEPNEFLSAPVMSYVFRLKEKSVGVEGKPSGGVATEPSVATKRQSAQPSSAMNSFFRSELRAIKEK